MSTKLGTLTLDLVTKIGGFIGPLEEAERKSKLSFENMRSHVNTYGAAVAGIALSTVTALAGMAVHTADQAAELEKFAFRANTTTQEFQKMAVGAQAYGIEQEKLSDMLKDFNEKLGELTTIGAGGGVDFFEKIAVKTEGSASAAKKLILEMQKLSGPEALQLYVKKLEEAGVTQQQMSFYLESMASDMTDLIPLLINGGEGMKLYSDAAERAGLVMSDETITQAKILKEQVYLLDLQLQGAKNQLMQAVIPAFVDISEAFFGGSEQGAQFTDIANGVGDGLRYIAKVAIGAATSVQLVGKTIGGLAAAGAALASGDLSGAKAIGSAMLDDLSSTALAAAERMDKISNSTASTTAKQMAALRAFKKTTGGVNAGLDELVSKQNKAEKATKDNSKALRDQNRIMEERRRIDFDYSTGIHQKELELEKEVQRLNQNGMSQYVEIAQARFEAEKKLNQMQFEWEISEHKLTESKKLAFSFNIKEQEILNDFKLTKEQRDQKLNALDELYKIEYEKLKISQGKQLLEVKKNWISAEDYAREYYALVREEILNTSEYSPDMKDALIKQANIQEGVDSNSDREQTWADYQSRFIQTDYYQQDVDLLAKARKQMLITEEEYQRKRTEMQLIYGSQYGASFAGMMTSLVDESSSAYGVLSAMQKGFTLYSVALSSIDAISKAWASQMFPYNLPAVGVAIAETGLLQATLQALTPTGFADGGFTGYGGKYEPAGIVHKGEGVLTQEEVQLLGGPSGFYALRSAIRNGFAEGGIVLDSPKLVNPQQNQSLVNFVAQNNSESQSSSTPINLNNINVLDPAIVGDYMGTSSGTKTFMNFIKNNRSSIKAIIA